MAKRPLTFGKVMGAKTHKLYYNPNAESGAARFVGGAVGTEAASYADRFITMMALQVNTTRNEIRHNVGLDRLYTHDAPDISLVFTVYGGADLTGDLLDLVVSDDDTHEIAVHTWQIRAESQDGETHSIRFRGKLTSANLDKGPDEQGGIPTVSCTLRVIDLEPTIAEDVSTTPAD